MTTEQNKMDTNYNGMATAGWKKKKRQTRRRWTADINKICGAIWSKQTRSRKN